MAFGQTDHVFCLPMLLVMFLQKCMSPIGAKNYTTQVEDEKRFANFAKNLKPIAYHNKLAGQGEYTYRLGLNKYADLVRSKSSFMYR